MSTYKNYLTNEEQKLLEKLVDKMQSGFSEKEFQKGRKANVEQLAKDASDPDFLISLEKLNMLPITKEKYL